jgi:hypothetical protein
MGPRCPRNLPNEALLGPPALLGNLVQGAPERPSRRLAAATAAAATAAMASGQTNWLCTTNAAPISAPTSMAVTDIRRRPARDPAPPATPLSAAMPVMVRVSTVVVRSGTASARAAAFCAPIEAASSTIRL